MVRRWVRAVMVAVFVPLTAMGVLVSTSGTAQALEWGPADRMAARALIRGVGAGGVLSTAGPATLARAESRCVVSGPAVAACTAGTVAVAALGVGVYATRGKWVPWLEGQIGDAIPDGPPEGLIPTCAWASPCNSLTLHGSMRFAQTPTQTQIITTYSGQLRNHNIHVEFRCANGIEGSFNPYIPRPTDPVQEQHWESKCFENNSVTNYIKIIPILEDDGGWNYHALGNGVEWEFGAGGPDPSAETTSRANCKRPDGTQYEVNKSSIPRDGYVQIAACDEGDTPTGMDMPDVGGGRTTLDLTQHPDDARDYPLCAVAACAYRIYIDGKPCTIGASGCTDWTYIQSIDPDRVSCHWGTYTVPIGGCNWMEAAYKKNPADSVATIPNVDGDWRTEGEKKVTTGTEPSPTTTARPTPSTPPRPSVTPTPENPREPCLNGSPECAPVVDPADPDGTNDCWPSGWGAVNPANWVLQPVKCALRWAFVPNATAIRVNVGTLMDAIGNAGPRPIFDAIGPIWTQIGDGAGCKGPGIPFNVKTVHEVVYPLDACTAPMSQVAAVSQAVSSVFIVVVGGVSCVNAVGGAFGYSVRLGRGAGGDES